MWQPDEVTVVGRWLSRSLTILLAVAVLVGIMIPAAGEVTEMLAEKVGGMYTNSSSPTASPSSAKPALESLRGNGTGIGYVLGHGNVIQNSESVTAAGFRKTRGKDYHIDYAGGSIIFTEPVRNGETVTVSYRYSENGSAQRTLVGLPGLALANNKNLSLNLSYSYQTASKEAVGAADVATYGMNAVTNIGNRGSLKSLFYFSTPQQGSQAVNHLAQNQEAPSQQQAKSDQMIIEEGEFGFGRLKLKMGYQDIGQHFSGMASLKESAPDIAALIPELTKEKGLKRFNYQAEMGIGSNSSLTSSMNMVSDKTDKIFQQSLGFSSSRMKASLNISEVGKEFGRFKDIKEANRDQLAREVGIKRQGIGLEFLSPGGAAESKWSKLGFNTISDASGAINSSSADIQFGGIGLSYYSRSVDKGFARLGSLSKDDTTQLALDIRRQFDSNATAAQVTDADRKQILQEAGIDHTNFGMNYAGKSFKTSVSNLSISDGGGTISRQSAAISGSKFSLNLTSQSIDDTFSRLAGLAPMERAQFGNERGMNRLNLAGSYKSGFGDLALGYARVTDSNGAIALKESLALAGKKYSIRAGFMSIDSDFARVGDLTDPDKALMQKERGFRRTDLAAKLKLSEHMDLDSFFYTSKSTSDSATRQQFRNQLNYNTSFGAKVSLFRDQYTAVSADGKETGYLHQYIKLDRGFSMLGGLMFNGLHDINTVTTPNGDTVTATISQTHLESNKNKRLFATADNKMIDFGDGRSENSQSYVITSKLAKSLSFNTALASIDRGDDGSEQMRSYNMKWAIGKRMNLSAEAMDKDGTKVDVTARRSYQLSGMIADKLAVFSNIKLTASRTHEDKQGTLFQETDLVKMEMGFLKGNLIAEFSGSNNSAGSTPGAKGFSFVSDRSDKNRLRFDIARKTRDLGNGQKPLSIYNYNANYKINAATALTYSSFAYQEKANGAIEQVGSTVMSLSTAVRGYSVTANYKREMNLIANQGRDIYGLGVAGKLPWGALVEVGYSLDATDFASGHTYTVKYNHQINADNFLTLTGQMKTQSAQNQETVKDFTARCDFNLLFH